MDDLAYRSTRELARAIRAGELSSRELVEATLARIEKLNGPLNAVVTLDEERARREADAADSDLRRGHPGRLLGVCMTVKDSFETAGMRTTSGAPMFSDHVPERDATPVARLRGAGAVIIGKTNLPIFAGDLQSYNEVFGRSSNPWDLAHTPGGSSGGAAAALAAGLTPLELGSDIGGSIRGPASNCGVTGHKPSFGIIPLRGHIPGPPGSLTAADIAVAGPMARDVDDLEYVLDILVGPDDWHGVGYKLALPPARHRSISDYRVAACFDDASSPVDGEVKALLEQAAKRLADAGARVDVDARPGFSFAEAIELFRRLLAAAMAGGIPAEQIEHMAQREGNDEESLAYRRSALRHREWLSLNERRLRVRALWHEFFKDWDAILLPSLPVPAVAHDDSEPMTSRKIQVNGEARSYLEATHWAGLTGVAYLPATVVPVGLTSTGLPVGMQIAGPFLEDRTTLHLGRELLELVGGFRRPPGY